MTDERAVCVCVVPSGVSNLSLHWINDLPGVMALARRVGS